MANQQNISTDLYDLLTTRNLDPEVTGTQGQASQPVNGAVFSFDYVSTSGKNYGTAVAVINPDDQELALYFGNNLGRSMEEPDKSEWFEFLQQLRQFATRHNFHTFSPKNLTQLKHTMAGMAAIKEGLFEGYYGTRRVSYMGSVTEARLVIEHNKVLEQDDSRHRNIKNLFIETAEGERFKLPFVNLAGGRAMLKHVRSGGRPYDIRGVHITEMISELKLLNRFNRASASHVVEGVTAQLREQAQAYYSAMRENLRSLATHRGYQRYFESWSPAEITETDTLVEDLKTLFVEQTIDARIEAALPVLVKIQQGSVMKEAKMFETWANHMVEGTWAMPDTPEKIKKLQAFMSQEQPLGPDAANATGLLHDIIGDGELHDRLADMANENPDADARIVVKHWIRDHQFDPKWQDMLRPVAVEFDADDQEQKLDIDIDNDKVTEVTRGISGLHGDLERTDIPAGTTVQRVKYQDVDRYKPDTEPDSHPRAATLDPRQGRLMKTVLSMKEGDNLATFEEPVQEAECNHTMEGESCPIHGMVKCDMYEDGKDPIDHRGAVTDSFHEELERIKTLASPKQHK